MLTYLAIVLILLSTPLYWGARSAWAFIAARIPKAKPPSLAGVFTAKAELEWYKLALICLVIILSRGVSLPDWPTDWKLPAWPTIGAKASHFIVLREATKDTDSFGKLAVELQDSGSAINQQIAAAGWKVWVLDDDNTTGDDKPNPLLEKLGVYGSINDSRRELLCIAPPDKLTHKETLPPDATAATVLSIMQARGKR